MSYQIDNDTHTGVAGDPLSSLTYIGENWPNYEEQSLFWSAVVEAAAEIQVPIEMAMMSALGAMSAACQEFIDVEFPTGHRVQTPLMLLTMAESGERKTTVQNQFFKSITKLNIQAIQTGEDHLDEYMAQKEVWKLEFRAWESAFRKSIKNDDEEASNQAQRKIQDLRKNEPPSPTMPRLLYDDVTPQALVQLLHEHSPYGCMLTSEANSVFSGRALQELDKMNTLWDGGNVIVDRLTRPSFILSGARLTMALMTQKSVIDRFLSKRGDEARGMGFLARFLVVKPKEMAGTRETRPLGSLPHLTAFNNRVEELLMSGVIGTSSSEAGVAERQVIKFSAPASGEWNRYHQSIENDQKENKPYFYYKDHASKLMENVSRIAAILHYFEKKDGDISTNTLQFAYDFARKCSVHFQRNLAGEPQVVADANALAEKLMEHAENKGQRSYQGSTALPHHLVLGKEFEFNLTFLKQYGPNHLRGRKNDNRLREAIELLRKMGYIKINHRGEYKIREHIFSGPDGPELRNGYEYWIASLPFFDEQEYYDEPHKKYLNYNGFYLKRPM